MRPREKALNLGFGCLSDSELLALVLRNGVKGVNSIDLANEILISCNGLAGLFNMSLEEIMQMKGIKLAKATQILASIELVRRLSYMQMLRYDVIDRPMMLVRWLQKTYGNREQEFFVTVFLDARFRVKGYKEVFVGSNNQVNIQSREIFNEALKHGAVKIIIAHNHPSQTVSPSQADIDTTNSLVKAGELMNIPVVDHIIISYDNYYSFKENKRI